MIETNPEKVAAEAAEAGICQHCGQVSHNLFSIFNPNHVENLEKKATCMI